LTDDFKPLGGNCSAIYGHSPNIAAHASAEVYAALILKHYAEASGGYDKTIDVYLKEVLKIAVYHESCCRQRIFNIYVKNVTELLLDIIGNICYNINSKSKGVGTMRRLAGIAAILSAALLMTGCGEPDDSSDSVSASTGTTLTTESDTADSTAVTTTAVPKMTTAKTTAAKTTEAKTTEAKTTEPATKDEQPYDYAGMAGYWYIDGDPSTASIHIMSNGRFETYYASGTLENNGSIKHEYDKDLDIYYFMLYSDSGDFIMGFVDDGKKDKNDIYIGNGGFPHYVRLYGEGGLGDDGRDPAEDFFGTWNCERATLTIEENYEMKPFAVIVWGDGANSHYTWEYPVEYKDGKLVCSGSGSKVHIWKLDETDSAPDFKILYSDGSAEFSFKGDGIVWNDLKENRGAGMLFTKTQD